MDILTKKKLSGAQSYLNDVEMEVDMKSTDEILKEMADFPIEQDDDNLSTESMPFNVSGGASTPTMPNIQQSKKSASNRTSDVSSASAWDETADDALMDDEIMNQQIGTGYTPRDPGYVSRNIFDFVDSDNSDEIVGDRVK